jgi:hypothetical protein
LMQSVNNQDAPGVRFIPLLFQYWCCLPFSRKGLGYTIGRGLDVLPFTCYSYWFSCYFDQRGKLMKALSYL